MIAVMVEVAAALVSGRAKRRAAVCALLVICGSPSDAISQTMPGPAYHDLMAGGHERLARDLTSLLDLRARPD